MIPLGLTAATPAIDTGIYKNILGSRRSLDLAHVQRPQLRKRTTTLIILNEEMKDIMKIATSLEDSSSLRKVVNLLLKQS